MPDGNKLSPRLVAGGCIAVSAAAVMGVAAGQGSRATIDVRVGVAPTALSGSDGQTHLAYEVLATDVTGTNAALLERIEVFGELEPTPLVSYSSNDLDQRVMRPETDPEVRYGRLIRSGTTALIHIWVTLANDRTVPKTLRHSFVFLAEDGTELAAGDAPVEIQSAAPLLVGSPFRAGIWLAHNAAGNHSLPALG